MKYLVGRIAQWWHSVSNIRHITSTWTDECGRTYSLRCYTCGRIFWHQSSNDSRAKE